MKVRKITFTEIDKLNKVLNELESLAPEIAFRALEDINFNDYEVLSKFNTKNADTFIENLTAYFREEAHHSILMVNLYTLLENCADLNNDTLDFNKNIKKGLELLDELEGEDDKYYIQTPGYVGNSLMWWGKNNKGYTSNLDKAGKYSKEEAQGICSNKDKGNKAYPVSFVNKHISKEVDMQYFDTSKNIF